MNKIASKTLSNKAQPAHLQCRDTANCFEKFRREFADHPDRTRVNYVLVSIA